MDGSDYFIVSYFTFYDAFYKANNKKFRNIFGWKSVYKDRFNVSRDYIFFYRWDKININKIDILC